MGNVIALSFSRDRDLQCPMYFHAKNIAKTYKEEVTTAMEQGGFVAKKLAEYRNHCIYKQLPHDASFFDNAHEQAPDPEDAKWLFRSFLRTPFAKMPVGAEWLQIESKLAFSWPKWRACEWFDKKHDVGWRFVPDFMYVQPGDGERLTELVIIDDKTGRGEPDEKQLEFYAWLGLQTYNQIGDGRQICNVRTFFNNLRSPNDPNEQVFKAEDLSMVERQLASRIEYVNMERMRWEPVACEICRTCKIPDCPKREQAISTVTSIANSENIPTFELKEITTQDEAERVLLFLQALDGVKTMASGSLRDWVAEHGPVLAGGQIAELTDVEKFTPDLPKTVSTAIAMVKAHGTKQGMSQEQAAAFATTQVLDVMSFGKSGIEKLSKRMKNPMLATMLLKTGEVSTYQKFDIKKHVPKIEAGAEQL